MWGKSGKQKNEALFGSENYTYLGKDVEIKGTAKFEGIVRIDGRFEGEIITNDTLIIGEEAIIKGSIRGGTVINSGRVEATITANQKVQLLKSSVLIGDVHSPLFSTEEGVYFQGHCDMGVLPETKTEVSQSEVENGKPEEKSLEVG